MHTAIRDITYRYGYIVLGLLSHRLILVRLLGVGCRGGRVLLLRVCPPRG